ncbi:DDE-type integrase/transposase/recombinase [Edaphobacter modestus]|uniref:DDE-type integrase/transposase/recombinase n=1 Tax=Edaphobacter modestus TaxID=388466 RepID=UPI001A91BF93
MVPHANDSPWRLDETYPRVRGRWVYLYCAVDRRWNPADFRLSPKPDLAAVNASYAKAPRPRCVPGLSFPVTFGLYIARG